jgi:hypothetical protein
VGFTQMKRFPRFLQDQEGMGRKTRLVSEMSCFQATGEMQQFPGSFTNPNPYILEDAQQSRVPRRKWYWENQNRKRKSPHQSQFSGARDGASVLDSKRNATRNLQACNMGATPEQHPGFVSKTISRYVERDYKLFGVNVIDSSRPVERESKLFGLNLIDISRREQENTFCKSSQETQYGYQRNLKRGRTKVRFVFDRFVLYSLFVNFLCFVFQSSPKIDYIMVCKILFF